MRARPATPADAQAVTDLIVAGDVQDLGEADYSLGDLQDEWRALDLGRDTLVIEDGRAIAGYAHFRGQDLLAQVAPGREGEGIGTRILEWAHGRARARGAAKIRQAAGSAASRALLEAHGYTKVRSYWRMERLTTGEEPDDPALRAARPSDAPSLYAIHEAAFARNADYEPKTETEWTRGAFEGHDVDHALSRVAPGQGFALVRRWDEHTLYIPLLAVHPDHQRRGLATRLLNAVFHAAHGAKVTLNVASDNPGAVDLYERAGMREAWRVDDYQRPLPD
jgi:ribosomal protein S18 acetylase RimI-like enzyme